LRDLTAASIRTEFPHTPTVRTGVFIPMSDGTRLAARIWLPEDADATPVPAVLEVIPYRLNDGTVASDHQQMTWFAGYGYAGVRVDIRGSGESDGTLTDEYTPQEQADCVEVIAWIAAQPWCTGAVGMMGYSWSGFNSLQVAAHRPPALRAIASCFASDDRFADDVHYRGGLVEPMDMVHWSTCMHGWQARPPDPEVVGERWREMWMERLEQPPWIEHWLAHQRRDAYWENGSVRDRYDQIDCAVMCVAGWTDGYTDAALRLMDGLDVPRRAVIGPWGHNDPVSGNPGPPVGILSELVRWWDRWLKDVPNGIDSEPMVVAYMQDSVKPSANLEHRDGRWIGETHWPPRNARSLTVPVGEGTIGSVQTVGLDGGAWCADGHSADLAVDQSVDDARSLTFTGEALDEPLEILGFPVARLLVSADQPVAMISLRVCEVRADGTSLMVTRAQLNLCHRDSHADPSPLEPGKVYPVTLTLDSIAHRFAAGSRIRISVSPCYWPLAWPSPVPVTLTLHPGDTGVELPVRPAGLADGMPRQLDAPEEPAALPSEQLEGRAGGSRTLLRDLGTGRAQLGFDWDLGGLVQLDNGLLYQDTSVATYTLVEGDPLSAEVRVENTAIGGRKDSRVDIVATGVMTCSETQFLVTSELEVRERGRRIFARTWTHAFPRDHC
jgi:uncharacterized protein